jgi:hypothetical protein
VGRRTSLVAALTIGNISRVAIGGGAIAAATTTTTVRATGTTTTTAIATTAPRALASAPGQALGHGEEQALTRSIEVAQGIFADHVPDVVEAAEEARASCVGTTVTTDIGLHEELTHHLERGLEHGDDVSIGHLGTYNAIRIGWEKRPRGQEGSDRDRQEENTRTPTSTSCRSRP